MYVILLGIVEGMEENQYLNDVNLLFYYFACIQVSPAFLLLRSRFYSLAKVTV